MAKQGGKRKVKKEKAKGQAQEKAAGKNVNAGGGAAVYGLGFIGALVYFIQTATGFWAGALGVLKAIVWPAILVYELLKWVTI